MTRYWTSFWLGLSVGFFLGAMAVTFVVTAHAQIICTQLGAYTTCDNGHESTIQADLGGGMGVIIGPRTTTPYVILGDRSSQAPLFLPAPSSEPLAPAIARERAIQQENERAYHRAGQERQERASQRMHQAIMDWRADDEPADAALPGLPGLPEGPE